jgi:hypothetical protein
VVNKVNAKDCGVDVRLIVEQVSLQHCVHAHLRACVRACVCVCVCVGAHVCTQYILGCEGCRRASVLVACMFRQG